MVDMDKYTFTLILIAITFHICQKKKKDMQVIFRCMKRCYIFISCVVFYICIDRIFIEKRRTDTTAFLVYFRYKKSHLRQPCDVEEEREREREEQEEAGWESSSGLRND